MKKTKIIATILVLCAILFSSCTNQIAPNTTPSTHNTTTTKEKSAYEQHKTIKLTQGAWAEKNSKLLNTTEKDLIAKLGTVNNLEGYTFYDDTDYKFDFENHVLIGISIKEYPEEYKPKLSEKELQAITDEIKKQLVPAELQRRYFLSYKRYEDSGKYYACYCKQINGLNSNDVFSITLLPNGQIEYFYSLIGWFDGIDKLDFDYDKALEACKKEAKNKYNWDNIFIDEADSEFTTLEDNYIYYRFVYGLNGISPSNPEFYYKICTVEEAKAYSAR